MTSSKTIGTLILVTLFGLTACPGEREDPFLDDPATEDPADRPPPAPSVEDDPWIVEEPDTPFITDTVVETDVDL